MSRNGNCFKSIESSMRPNEVYKCKYTYTYYSYPFPFFAFIVVVFEKFFLNARLIQSPINEMLKTGVYDKFLCKGFALKRYKLTINKSNAVIQMV